MRINFKYYSNHFTEQFTKPSRKPFGLIMTSIKNFNKNKSHEQKLILHHILICFVYNTYDFNKKTLEREKLEPKFEKKLYQRRIEKDLEKCFFVKNQLKNLNSDLTHH